MTEADRYAEHMGEGRYDDHPEDYCSCARCDETREKDAAVDAMQDAQRLTRTAESGDRQTFSRFYHLDEVIDPTAIAYASLLQDISTINATMSRCSDRAELWQLLTIARDIEEHAAKLVDAVFDRIGRILAAADDDTTESPF